MFNKAEYMEILRQMVKLSPFVAAITMINVFLQSCISHPQIAENVSVQNELNESRKLIFLLNIITEKPSWKSSAIFSWLKYDIDLLDSDWNFNGSPRKYASKHKHYTVKGILKKYVLKKFQT